MAASSHDGRPVFLRQRQDPEDPTEARFTLVTVDVIADRADGWPDAHRGFEQRHCLRRRTSWAIGIGDPVPAPWSADMLAQELTGLRIEQADVHTSSHGRNGGVSRELE